MYLMYVVISTTYMSSDVESPSVKKAVANYEAHEDHARADLGYDSSSSWFWFFLTPNEADIVTEYMRACRSNRRSHRRVECLE